MLESPQQRPDSRPDERPGSRPHLGRGVRFLSILPLAWIPWLPWFIPDRPVLFLSPVAVAGEPWTLVEVDGRKLGPTGLEIELRPERPGQGFGDAPILYRTPCWTWTQQPGVAPDDSLLHAHLKKPVPCYEPEPAGRVWLFMVRGRWQDARVGWGGGQPCKQGIDCNR